MQFKADAPGSLMLLGEYGVLYGKHALVCAIDKRITVILTPRQDAKINIQSNLAHDGKEQITYTTDITHLHIERPFQFVLGALKHMQSRLRFGCDLHIQSEFSAQLGLGSSAAVTVATLAVLYTWLGVKTTALDLVRQGRNVVRAVQGVGSGADIAASVLGGIVGYQAQPLSAEKFTQMHLLSAIYAGYKTPTSEAIKQVQQRFQGQPALLRSLTNSIGQCATDGMQAVRRAEWQRLGEIMNVQQGLMEALGVSSQDLRSIVEKLRAAPKILGAKISGAGLGDCIIGLGEMDNYESQPEASFHVPLAMTLQGVSCEKI